MTGEVFRLSDAAVLTPAVAGAASPADFAGAVAPADLAGTDVPAVAGMEFPAVAEDLSLTDDAGGSPSVIYVSEPLRAVVGAVPLMDVVRRRPVGLSDSDVRRNSEEGSSPVDIVTVPELIEHSAVGGIADPPSAGQPMKNTGESRDLQNGRQSDADNRNVPLDVGT